MGKQIQVLNYNNPLDEDSLQPPGDRLFYTTIFIGVFAFFAMSYPYREINIPSILLAMVGLLVIVALTVSSWMRPQYYWACIAFAIYIPFSGKYPGDFGGRLLGINFTNVLLVPVIVQLLMQRNSMDQPWMRLHRPDIPLLCFILLSSISLFRGGIEQGGGYASNVAVDLKRWLFPFLIYFVFVNLGRNEKAVKYLIAAIGMCLTAIGILAMKESFDIGPRGSWDDMRIQGVLGQPNSTGTFFVYYTLIFFGFFICNWQKKRYWLLLIPFLICGRALTLANSRGGLIAFTIATLTTLLFRSKRLFIAGLTVVILGSIFNQYLPETISGRLFTTIRAEPVNGEGVTEDQGITDRLDKSAYGRLAIWNAGIQMVRDRPWFGWGYKEFERKVGIYDISVAGLDPHNTYLGIAAEMGLIALFFFVFSLIMILWSCLRVYRRSPDPYMRSLGLSGAGMIMGVLCANFFGSRLDTTELTAYVWIISAMIVQYDRELTEKSLATQKAPQKLLVNPWIQDEETA